MPLREAQVVYVRSALEEYHKISENFIQHVEKNKDSVPVVKLELSLDEKELRPEGLAENEEWWLLSSFIHHIITIPHPHPSHHEPYPILIHPPVPVGLYLLMEGQPQRIGEYRIGMTYRIQRRRWARARSGRWSWRSTSGRVRRWLWRCCRRKRSWTFRTSSVFPVRYTSSNWSAIHTSSNSTKLSRRPSISFSSWSTAREESYSTTLLSRKSNPFCIQIDWKGGLSLFSSDHRWSWLPASTGHRPPWPQTREYAAG